MIRLSFRRQLLLAEPKCLVNVYVAELIDYLQAATERSSVRIRKLEITAHLHHIMLGTPFRFIKVIGIHNTLQELGHC